MMARKSLESLSPTILTVVVVLQGCATPGPSEPTSGAPEVSQEETAEESTVAQEPELPSDDLIVPSFDADANGADGQAMNTRSDASPADPRPVPTDDGQRPDSASTQEDPAKDKPYRTSMPAREKAGVKAARLGGVRKATPVDQQASALFGLWMVDPAGTSADLMDAQRVLFLADGRMRVWKKAGSEDGRWTWTSDAGVKTGGIEGVAFSLGEFEEQNGNITISLDPENKVVLIPDRMFHAPAPREKKPD